MIQKWPVVFKREAQSQVAGAIMYLLMFPMLAFITSGFCYGMTHAALIALGASENISAIISGVVTIVALVALGRYTYREYRSRASCGVRIHRNRLETWEGSHSDEIRFDRITNIQIKPRTIADACVFRRDDHSTMTLPHEVASYEKLREPLQVQIIPHLVEKLDAELSHGKTFEVRDRFPLRHVLTGILMVTVVPLMLLRRRSLIPTVVAKGIRRIRQGIRSLSGGFRFDQHGIGRAHDTKLTPWSQIAFVDVDSMGVTIMSHDEQFYRASPYAQDFWVSSTWIEQKLGEQEKQMD